MPTREALGAADNDATLSLAPQEHLFLPFYWERWRVWFVRHWVLQRSRWVPHQRHPEYPCSTCQLNGTGGWEAGCGGIDFHHGKCIMLL
jgi:hypothetical protein